MGRSHTRGDQSMASVEGSFSFIRESDSHIKMALVRWSDLEYTSRVLSFVTLRQRSIPSKYHMFKLLMINRLPLLQHGLVYRSS